VSTILKALQRLEDEKSAGVARSLDEQVVAHRSQPAPDRRGLRIGIVAIGGVAVAAAAFLLWPTQGDPDAVVAAEPPPPATAPVAAPSTAQQVAAETPRRSAPARTEPAELEQGDLSEAQFAAVVEVVKRLDAQPADSAGPAAQPNRVAPTAEAETKRSARRPGARRSDTPVAHGAPQPRVAEQQVANAQAPVTPISGDFVPANAAQEPPPPIEIAALAVEPARAALPASIPAAMRAPEQKVIQRAKLPALRIEKTVWHPDTDRRIAIVKLIDREEVLRLKEGDAIGPLVIESINPGSVLFSHDGIEVKYNVGS